MYPYTEMLLGAHVSAAGSLANAPKNASELGLETFQFFSRPPQGGKVNPITEDKAEEFHQTCSELGFERWYIHAPYVINLASKEGRVRGSSVDILKKELERASVLGARGMMFHPGSASGVGEEKGFELVIEGMKKILDGYEGSAQFLIEITAGAGMTIGDAFEEIRTIMDGIKHPKVGVCFDTAHAFASGYDLRTEDAVEKTMAEFDEIVGLEHLMLSHCNDSKVDIGERKDRHEHLGHGYIGKAGFEAIVASKSFEDVDLILETPHDEGLLADIALLKKLREGNN